MRRGGLLCWMVAASGVQAAEPVTLDTVSVTATREERATKDVPASIAVVGEERIDNSRMFNITDALSGIPGVLLNSKNGGYDARVIIRGAGLKANYGIREIMLLRDGVPITDPDSFTRLDFIDTQDIERIEVEKGPGSLYALGSAGGTIQIISKSVFDTTGNNVKLGAGNRGARSLHARVADTFGADEDQAVSGNYSQRALQNEWRRDWNEFDSKQLSLKYGTYLSGEGVVETELSYATVDLQLPGDMDDEQFATFKDTGKQTGNNSAFKHAGRYSQNLFFNSRLEKTVGATTYKPRVYINVWSHLHPVTGRINDTKGVTTVGTDLEFSRQHQLWGDASLAAGLTLKQDRNSDDKKYKYADIQTTPSGRIIATLSDRRGDLIETSKETNTVTGIFARETLHPADRWLVDVGFRLDKIRLNSEVNEMEAYSYSSGSYVPGTGLTKRDRSFNLFSPSLGASYAYSDQLSLFVNLAQAGQVPFSNELDQNPDLHAAKVRNFEVGLKGRAKDWSFDTSVYVMRTIDEIIAMLVDGQTVFQNAGSTHKKGFEFAGSRRVLAGTLPGRLWLGVAYAYSDYQYAEFNEAAGSTVVDRSGNQLPYVPRNQYSLTLRWEHLSGVTVYLQSDSWGSYYLDSANSEKYSGYDFITSLNINYTQGPHTLGANVQNLTDKRYAVEVKKDARGNKSYTPGTPRSFLLSYRYAF